MEPDSFERHDLQLARRIHRTLLPKRLVTPEIEIDVRYDEMNLLGGDYATVSQREPGRIVICICDVTGHGLAAALLAGRVNSFVRYGIRRLEHPRQVVDELNAFIWRNFRGLGLYLTFFCVEIDLAAGRVQYAGCGHPPAMLWRARTQECIRLASRHVPIGVLPELQRDCELDSAAIEPGDRLLVYTDGVIETTDREGQQFGIEGVESMLAATDPTSDTAALLDETYATLQRFRHGPQTDDVFVVAARFL